MSEDCTNNDPPQTSNCSTHCQIENTETTFSSSSERKTGVACESYTVEDDAPPPGIESKFVPNNAPPESHMLNECGNTSSFEVQEEKRYQPTRIPQVFQTSFSDENTRLIRGIVICVIFASCVFVFGAVLYEILTYKL